jgi:uncharacterized GH25 family protein
MNVKKRSTCLNVFFFMIMLVPFLSGVSSAHDLWVTLDNYDMKKTASASLAVYNAHKFEAGVEDYLPADRLDQVFFLTPDGQQAMGSSKGDGKYGPQKEFKKGGTYLAVAIPKNGYGTRTTEGYQLGKSKKDVSKAISCWYSEKFAKTVYAVKNPGGDSFSKVLGYSMEIIPLKDPNTLKVGEMLPVKVLLEGQPARTMVFGTYAGFTEAQDTFAYTTRTNTEGIAEIKLIHPGTWLLVAKHQEAYPDNEVCDTISKAASLTFNVR